MEKAKRSGSFRKLLTGERELSGQEKGVLIALCLFLCLALALLIFITILVRPPQRFSGKDGDGAVSVTEQTDPSTGESYRVEVPLSQRDGFYNILICGVDQDKMRTDTMIIARLNTKDHSTALVSVPRDTLCWENTSVKAPKLNSLYAYGGLRKAGMEYLTDQLETMFNFHVDGYMLIDLEGFAAVIDLIGGVDFDVAQDMDYDDPSQELHIHLKAGQQHLDGDQARQLCRFRGYPMADIDRCGVQQDFLRAASEQFFDSLGFSKLQKLTKLFNEFVITDLSVGNLIFFGRELINCDLEKTETATLPGYGADVYGASYWVLNPEGTLDIINDLVNPYDRDMSLSDMNLRTE